MNTITEVIYDIRYDLIINPLYYKNTGTLQYKEYLKIRFLNKEQQKCVIFFKIKKAEQYYLDYSMTQLRPGSYFEKYGPSILDYFIINKLVIKENELFIITNELLVQIL